MEALPTAGFFISGEVDAPNLSLRLNEFAAAGWELVTSYTTAHSNGGTNSLIFIYKRPASAAPPPVQPTQVLR